MDRHAGRQGLARLLRFFLVVIVRWLCVCVFLRFAPRGCLIEPFDFGRAFRRRRCDVGGVVLVRIVTSWRCRVIRLFHVLKFRPRPLVWPFQPVRRKNLANVFGGMDLRRSPKAGGLSTAGTPVFVPRKAVVHHQGLGRGLRLGSSQ